MEDRTTLGGGISSSLRFERRSGYNGEERIPHVIDEKGGRPVNAIERALGETRMTSMVSCKMSNRGGKEDFINIESYTEQGSSEKLVKIPIDYEITTIKEGKEEKVIIQSFIPTKIPIPFGGTEAEIAQFKRKVSFAYFLSRQQLGSVFKELEKPQMIAGALLIRGKVDELMVKTAKEHPLYRYMEEEGKRGFFWRKREYCDVTGAPGEEGAKMKALSKLLSFKKAVEKKMVKERDVSSKDLEEYRACKQRIEKIGARVGEIGPYRSLDPVQSVRGQMQALGPESEYLLEDECRSALAGLDKLKDLEGNLDRTLKELEVARTKGDKPKQAQAEKKVRQLDEDISKCYQETETKCKTADLISKAGGGKGYEGALRQVEIHYQKIRGYEPRTSPLRRTPSLEEIVSKSKKEVSLSQKAKESAPRSAPDQVLEELQAEVQQARAALQQAEKDVVRLKEAIAKTKVELERIPVEKEGEEKILEQKKKEFEEAEKELGEMKARAGRLSFRVKQFFISPSETKALETKKAEAVNKLEAKRLSLKITIFHCEEIAKKKKFIDINESKLKDTEKLVSEKGNLVFQLERKIRQVEEKAKPTPIESNIEINSSSNLPLILKYYANRFRETERKLTEAGEDPKKIERILAELDSEKKKYETLFQSAPRPETVDEHFSNISFAIFGAKMFGVDKHVDEIKESLKDAARALEKFGRSKSTATEP